MARIRTIKPEFWSSEQIMDLSPMARLLFIGLWNFCDDGGNHPASAKTLKAEIFPSDDITSSSVQLLIDELSSNYLITPYDSNGKGFWHVNGWKHQKIDKPTFKHPPFIGEESGSTSRGLDEASPPEGKGREGSKPSDESNVGGTRTPPDDETHFSRPQPGDHHAADPRKGPLCKALRLLNFDAQPRYAAWTELLTHTDEEIIEYATWLRDSNPGKSWHMNYLIKPLADRKEPSITGGSSHATRQGSVAATIAAFTRSDDDSGAGGGGEEVIEGTATRVVEPG